MLKKGDIRTLDEFADEKFGKVGTHARDEIERGFEEFKLGYLIQEARKKKGLTQQELADKVGTNKAAISRVENDVKDVRLSTLRKIIETGLGGELELAIKL
ncbi:MAG: helix-turn-helix domain-containing protein [Pyrinomonadaceae bacterium]